jgi:hypothetical protein
VHVVALTQLRSNLEDATPGLATALGLAPYDVRSRLSGALPKVVCQTPDDDVARRVAQALMALGHGVVVCDTSAIVPTAAMVHLHRFHIDAEGLWANDSAGERLAWGDVGAVIIALLRSDIRRTKEELATVTPRIGRVADLPVVVHVTSTEHGSSHAAYLFPHPRAERRRPWVLEEATAQFLSLGPKMQPTRRANFLATVTMMRRFAPGAIFDDRFATHPVATQATTQVHAGESAPPPVATAIVDTTMHILATTLLADRGGPYRG